MVSVAIVTRNAIHGGVETMIALHARIFEADVFVAGGHNRPDSCPFKYTYISAENPKTATTRLARFLVGYDVIIYHWIPAWAQEAVRSSGVPAIEVVHREDTSDNDKDLPVHIVTHSPYLAAFLNDTRGQEAQVIPHAVDVSQYPAEPMGSAVGGLTSYYPTKGIDVLLQAWAQIESAFPAHLLRLYGAGRDVEDYLRMVQSLGLRRAELLGPTNKPERHIAEFCLYVVPSRIEGMPFSVLEALASNIPVIVSDLPGMRDFNQQAIERGFAPPLILTEVGNVGDLAKHMTTLLEYPQLSDTREYIAQAYGVEQHATQWWRAIERTLEPRATGARRSRRVAVARVFE